MTGTSAGGIGAFTWVQHAYKYTKKAKVVGIPGSGVFLKNFESPTA